MKEFITHPFLEYERTDRKLASLNKKVRHKYLREHMCENLFLSVNLSNSMQQRKFTPDLIAPCGMNCGICIAFFGYTMSGKKRKHICITCRLRKRPCAFIKKQCDKLTDGEIEYCFECTDFPCNNLTTLDRRYRAKYRMSMIENLKELKEKGMETFLENQENKYKCPQCGDIICVHDRKCYTCGYVEK